ncbi:conjugal transfer protein MobB [Limibacterium fermenti]|uniref:conjugal transfer protein MobB n=1 Tax=Limibacterium fermenti TaxID=3229863 RepID=UPI003A75E357
MVADIHIGNNLYGALAYNQVKIDAGLGKILETNRVFVPADGQFSVGDCMRDFERAVPPQVTTTRGIIHISLNPHPEDKISDDQLADIGREYMKRLGFGSQPYMIFKHEDIDRQHLHIVSTRVRSDGSLISDKNNYEKSKKITDDLEQKYGFHPKDKKQGEAWQLSPVDVSRSDLKKQVANVIKPLATMYQFKSLGEYRALLSLYNIGVEKVEGDNQGHKYTGLVYLALDAEGNRTGKPLKSSLFGKSYGIEALEQSMKKSAEELKVGGQAAKTKALVSASLMTSRNGGEFRANLREEGIDLVLRYGNGGRLFGVTFIDHNSRTVLNGSALGKEFSANALGARFADFLTGENPQEDIKPVPSAPVREVLRPSVQHEPENKQPATAKGYGGDDSSVGSLLSVLTPEPDQYSNEQQLPKKRKKKKRRYGRQV